MKYQGHTATIKWLQLTVQEVKSRQQGYLSNGTAE